ncbi:MAG TPA: hypothetical protein VJ984_03820 [Xanthomonadales bacterium]|nr:hypothetical protein [Xanthomonadales bacterium]
MDTAHIESMIAENCNAPDARSDIGELLGGVADRQGLQVSDEDLESGSRFVCRYIELVPYMMKVAWTAASTVGLAEPMQKILRVVESYWLEGEDIIPDQLGIIGLLDDAYCSLTSMQLVSDHYQFQTGKYLFPDDLTGANKAMRKIIGEPYGSDLDRLVTSTMQSTGLIDAVKALASPEKKLDFSQKSTIWNHGPAGDIDLKELDRLGLLEDAP